MSDDELRLLERVLAQRQVRCVYQPLVEIDSGSTVAFEALARGPEGSALERPDLLFAAARRARRVRDLDVACRVAALAGARAAGLADPWRLFINAEPEALDGWRPPPGSGVPLTVILELTERALTARPAELLQTVARVRELGWGVALDDVGADPASLALLPLVRPDVIKLDLRLVQQQPTRDVAAVMHAVHAEAERSGTLVLAEGLETEQHVRTARALGATLGQGWFFGRPGPLPVDWPVFAGEPVRIVPRRSLLPRLSPFELAARVRRPRAAVKPLLIEISKQLEEQARHAGESAVVLSTFQDVEFFTPATRRRYAGLAASAAFVAALGAGMPPAPLPGVRGAVLPAGDPLLGEWDVVVLGPHFAACLTARDLGDGGPDASRRFEFVLSHDRELTTAVANLLMSRVWPEPKVADLPELPEPASVPLLTAALPAGRPAGAGLPGAGLSGAGLSPELLDRALAAAGTGITVADMTVPDCPLVWVNPAFSVLSGYAAEQVLGRNCRMLQGPGTDPRAVAEIGAAVAAGRELRTRLTNVRPDGTPWLNELHLSPVFDAAGRLTHYVGVQNDVTARVEAEQRVTHLAYHDPLTGLPNRTRLAEVLGDALLRTRRLPVAAALLFLDLDGFKDVNDVHGHDLGDALLRQLAGRLRAALRADDVLARQGGDEFLVLLADLPAARAGQIATQVADQLLRAVREPVDLGPAAVQTTASIGISVAPADAADAGELLRSADAAMYAVKRAGGDAARRGRGVSGPRPQAARRRAAATR